MKIHKSTIKEYRNGKKIRQSFLEFLYVVQLAKRKYVIYRDNGYSTINIYKFVIVKRAHQQKLIKNSYQ